MATATEIFEAIAGCYYRRFHRLAPGKSEPIETHRDSNDEENREQYGLWCKTGALVDAATRIVELETALALLADAAEDTLSSHEDELQCCLVTRERCGQARALLR